jgi:alginate O-acetyltransferase complex protein AlgI
MLFNSFQFALFFFALWLLHRSLPPRHRNGLLLGASLLFYAMWVPIYLVLLLAEIVVCHALLRVIARGRHARLALVASTGVTLGILAGFKYAALAVETVAPVLRFALGFEPPIPEVFLPLGISFFSFQMLGLAIDVYRGDVEPPRTLTRYMLFVSFFPQLIAGPILRGGQFLPQLARGAQPTTERTRRGLWLIACGLLKKVVLADFLLAPFVDSVFRVPGLGSAAFHWVAAFSFAFQIYYDFSGYTDIARGLALLLGFEMPVNFLEPYLSRDPSEFWRRWHITLSTWLRDYLYIPLGGNRMSQARTLTNLVITMLLGGLWHGAAWTFVAWGGIHGLLLVLHRELGKRRNPERPLSLRDGPAMALTFLVVTIAWVFFRATSFADANDFLSGMLGAGPGTGWPVFQTGVVILCAALHGAERMARLRAPALRDALAARRWGPVLEAAALGAVAGAVVAASGSGGEFIYFQF